MSNRANQLAEQIEALSWELADEVNRSRGLLPCKRDWKAGDTCFVRDRDGVYQDVIESVDEEGQTEAKLRQQSHTISTAYLFESEEDVAKHTFWDCLDKRTAGITPVRRWDDNGKPL